jgi:hypothetical protein
MPAWLNVTHEEYRTCQAWPWYRPRLNSFQIQVGVRIHEIYADMRRQNEVEMMKGMFGG